MSRTLRYNVLVDGKWYGPDYGSHTPGSSVASKITNPAAWSDGEAGDASPDLRFRADDFATNGEPVVNLASLAPAGASPGGPGVHSAEDLGGLEPDDLAAYAAARGIADAPVKTKGDREKLIARLTGQ